MTRSSWMGLVCDTDKHKSAILSWFAPLCDEMEPISAQVLCDAQTDREKKLRALMVDADGKKHWAIRTATRAGFTLELKPA